MHKTTRMIILLLLYKCNSLEYIVHHGSNFQSEVLVITLKKITET